MKVITDEASFEATIEATTDPALRRMLAARLKLYRANCLIDLTMLLVLDRGETAEDIERESGINPLVNPIDGARYGSPKFHQYADWISFEAGHHEWLTCIGNSGRAVIALVADQPGADPLLLDMLRSHGGKDQDSE